VTRSALQNGASVACLLLTTESIVADIPKEKSRAAITTTMATKAWAEWVAWVEWAAAWEAWAEWAACPA